jgi:hypothetical protein
MILGRLDNARMTNLNFIPDGNVKAPLEAQVRGRRGTERLVPGAILNRNQTLYSKINRYQYERKSEWIENAPNVSSSQEARDIRKKTAFIDRLNRFSANDRFSYFHPLEFVEHIQKAAPQRAEALRLVQDMVIKLPCIQENKTGIFGIQSATFCNHAVFLTVQALDRNYCNIVANHISRKDTPPDDVRHLGSVPEGGIDGRNSDGGYFYKTANIWYDILVNKSINHKASGVLEVTGPDAQALADMGYTVIGAYKNPNSPLTENAAGTAPHYVTVAPAKTTVEYDDKRGPLVAHVGGGDSSLKDASDAFVGYFNFVRWFFNYKQDHCLNLDTIHKLSGRGQ